MGFLQKAPFTGTLKSFKFGVPVKGSFKRSSKGTLEENLFRIPNLRAHFWVMGFRVSFKGSPAGL